MHFKEAKGLLSAQNGMNLYRGCTHGCIYCDARSRCYQMEHAFEDVEVKANGPELLEYALRHRRRKGMIATGAMTDPYMKELEPLGYTRRCLEIIEKYGFGLAIQTKSARILRDLDLLEAIHRKARCVVQMTLTTYDDRLAKILEPNVSTTGERFRALMALRQRGIPTVVWICPILPYLNDTEENLRGLLDYCREAGVRGILNFGMGLTLREGNREYFYKMLDRHFPGLRQRYMAEYGLSYQVMSPNHRRLTALLTEFCQMHGILCQREAVFQYLREFPAAAEQISLFD